MDEAEEWRVRIMLFIFCDEGYITDSAEYSMS